MLEQLINNIIVANEAYRIGKPIMSDEKYDILINELRLLEPEHELLNVIGHEIMDDGRKAKLPITMASMNKVKTVEELEDWMRLRNIDKNEIFVITPKFDGLALCVNELTDEAYTRGDGAIGQKSDEHYKFIGNKLEKGIVFEYTFGEVMMPKKTFLEKYSNDFANPRNLVSGLLNSKDINESLKDTVYIKYGATSLCKFNKKSELLDSLNARQSIKVSYILTSLDHLTEEFLLKVFKEWSTDFEIDGLIIEVDDLSKQESMGRERSTNNPCWARAFKSEKFEQTGETEITGITWNISKQGLLKPTVHLKPIKLDGVTISNVTGNNARFVKDMGLGVGAIVSIRRSGMVIPLITDVIKAVDFEMPDIENIDWNENGIELITLTETDEQKFKQLVSFFDILDADSFAEGVIKQLWDAGYTTLKDILNISISDLERIDRFGKRKSYLVHNSIKKSTSNVNLSKLQHATGIFDGLGSKKLALLEHFTTKPSVEEVMKVEGFAEISAKSYVNNYDRFFEFIKDLPISISKKVEVDIVSDKFVGKSFVFTGIRLPEYEAIIEKNGGKVSSSVSKNTTYLVMKEKGSGSSKESKAIDLGVIILNVDELKNLLEIN
jgi:NAD-dependent DNA ligase